MKGKPLAAAFWAFSMLASSLAGQTAQTALFRAVMSSSGGNSGTTDVLLHLVKDSSGNILSGSLDFNLAYQFPNDEVVTGIAVSGGGAALAGGSTVQAIAGSGRISSQVQVAAGNQAGLGILAGVLANPTQYTVNVMTAAQPTGAMSGTLQSATAAVLMAVLNSSAGAGAATVMITYTGPAYALTSAAVEMQTAYQFPSQVTLSGMRIYTGQGGTGSIAVAADLMPGTPSAAGGAGVLTAPATQIDMANSTLVKAVQDILLGPANFSMAVDTVENPTAPLTGTLRVTDSMIFQIPGFAGSGAASEVALHTLREASGEVVAGTVIFDVNYRLTEGAQIEGIVIDDNIAAPAVLTDPSGFGNAYAWLPVGAGVGQSILNNMVDNPAGQIMVLTATGAFSQQAALAPANTAAPVVAAVIPIVEVKTLATFAPGELVEIYGVNLAQSTTDLSGWPGGSLPSALNGVSVTLGGIAGRILYVSPNQVDAAFAFETPLGSQMFTLTNAGGTSVPIALQVAAVAPALYNFAFENVGFSLVNQANPASGGDTLVFYATGMGQTTPALATGESIPLGPPYFDTLPVTVAIGGANASVIYSIAAPPYVAGLYQIAVTVPVGLPPGNQPVVATCAGGQSNTVTIVTQ